ncbi:MAG: fibronectin type III domain-containing protein [Bacteroidia bacterium]
MATLKVGAANLNAVDLAAKALRLHTMMTGNVNFPTPLPDLATLLAAMTALNTAITEAATKDSNKIVARNLRSKELKQLITQLGAYVQNVSNGDSDKILSSGFELRKQPAPVGVVAQPQSLVARATLIVGEIRLYWASVNGARSYQIEYKDLGFTGDGGVTPTPGSPTPAPGPAAATWQELKSLTSSGFSASGLVSGHIYQFRVRALGASGFGAWSDLAQERAR